MPSFSSLSTLLAALLVASGCGAASSYTPARGSDGLLVLGYDQGVTIRSDANTVMTEPRFVNLYEEVACVPRARRHARRARKHGRAALGLGIAGGGLGIGALGGLAGLAVIDERPTAGWAALGSGLAAAAVGIGLAIGSRHHRTQATGHAVDAVNEYNDARLRGGRRCRRRAREVG